MNPRPHAFSLARSVVLVGLVGALVAFAFSVQHETAFLVSKSPTLIRQPDIPPCTVSRCTPTASDAQREQINQPDEVESMDEWMRVSPRRARLMSPEAMAGYEPILTALNLSPRQLHRLRQLIVERAESANDADQLGKERRLGPEQTRSLRNEAEASFDRELEAVVGTANFPIMQAMLQLTPQLGEIAHSIGHQLAQTDAPLDAEQMLKLAQLYQAVYLRNPKSFSLNHSAGVDPKVELSDVDRQTLTQASGLLTPHQLDILQGKFAITTTAYAIQP